MKKIYLLFSLMACFRIQAQSVLNKPAMVFAGHSDDVTALAYSPYAKFILSGAWDNSANLYNEEGKLQKSMRRHTAAVEAVAFSRDGKYIFTGSNDFSAMQFDALSGSAMNVFVGHTANVTTILADGAGKYLYTGSEDGTIKLWDLGAGGNLFKTFTIGSPVHALALSNDGKTFFVACNSKDVIQFDLTGKEVKRYQGHKDFINSIALSLNGKYMVSGGNDKNVLIWDLKTGKLFKELSGHTLKVNSVVFSYDSKYIISGSNDGTAMVWNVESGLPLYILNDQQDQKIRSVAITFDKKFIYTSGKVKDQKTYGVRAWKVPFDTLEKKSSATVIGQNSKDDKNNGLADPSATPKPPAAKPANATGNSNPNQNKTVKPGAPVNSSLNVDSTRMTMVPDTEAMRKTGRMAAPANGLKSGQEAKPKTTTTPASKSTNEPEPSKPNVGSTEKPATNKGQQTSAQPKTPPATAPSKVEKIKAEQQQREQKEKEEKERLEKITKEKADSIAIEPETSDDKPKSKFRKLK